MAETDKPGVVVTAVAAATALVTGVAALTATGVLGRVQRNHGQLFALSIGLVVLGTGLLLAARAIPAGKRKVLGKMVPARGLVDILGSLLSIAGVIVGFCTAVTTARDREQPRVMLSIDSATLSAEVTANADNLGSDDRLTVYVEGLQEHRGQFDAVALLYKASVGPDTEGQAQSQISTAIPPGRYAALGVRAVTSSDATACDYLPIPGQREPSGAKRTGCLIARLPHGVGRPDITAEWDRDTVDLALDVGLDLTNATGPPEGPAIALSVFARKKSQLTTVYQTVFDPSPSGTTHRDVHLPIGAGVDRVCVQGVLMTQRVRAPRALCPLKPSARTTTVELAVPGTFDSIAEARQPHDNQRRR